MSFTFRSVDRFGRAGPRADDSNRITGFVLALLAEAGLILIALSLGWIGQAPDKVQPRLVSITITADTASPKPDKAKTARAAASPQSVQRPVPQTQTPTPPAPVPLAAPPPPIIPLSRSQMAAFDISRLPRATPPAAPAKGLMGPADLGVPGDSKRVGTAPGGQPMYAAAWYREPYPEELRGYLSLADGPGWALIACRTVPDFKVDDCVGLDEYPTGSQIQRAVLAAAWQFKVRPPRVGGVSRVGDWVRIRIDYEERRR
ncbi:MAG: hypothetical protein ACKOQ3_02350 [Novosphingobium sp.]